MALSCCAARSITSTYASSANDSWRSPSLREAARAFCLSLFVAWILFQLTQVLGPLEQRGYEASECSDARQQLVSVNRVFEAASRAYRTPSPEQRRRLDEALIEVRRYCT